MASDKANCSSVSLFSLVMASRSVDQSTFLEDDFTATCGGDHHQ